ncbi:MAG: hypothetical protein AAGA84_08300 [Pseudomonadota bacterium]
MADDKIDVENINTPGKRSRVNRAKYDAMRKAYLAVLPMDAPGLTQRECMDAVKPMLPDALYPQGKTSGWWVKTVQLDLEAKGLVVRSNTRPLRWWRLS